MGSTPLYDIRRRSPQSYATRSSIEPKALLTDEVAEIGAGRLGILARFVLRPAVEAGFAPALDTALAPIGPQRRAAPIVGLDLGDNVAFAIMVLDDRGRERQPRRDLAGLLGPADAKSGDRNRARRQIERFGNDPRTVPDRADRAGAKADSGRGLDERRQHDRAID